MANNLHFEYSLSVNEKQTQQNLATFIKKTFGTDKNAKLSVPIKLDISTNLTNVDLKSIQDQLDKQFKGKLNLHATVKIDSSNVARQAQAELDKISKSLSLKVGLEVDPSAMKLMLGTVDVIKTLNKEVTKVKDNLKDLGKKIEININGAQINNVYDGALRTAEKIQKVNAQTTEEINEQLAMTKEQLAHQKKLAEEKKKELDIEKEKQANNKKIEESNKNIRKQQQQLNKELKNVEAQIAAEKKKADVLDKQAKSAKSTAKVQEDATKKIEKSTEKIAELEKQRADNQAFLQSKREEEKALLTNIELNKQEITLLRTKIKEMEKLAKATVTVTKTTGTTKTTTTQAPKKPTAKKTSNKKVVQVDSPVTQATVQATNAVNNRIEAEDKVTKTVEQQAQAQAKSVQAQINNQDKLVQHTESSAKKIETAVNKAYRAEDSKRKLKMPNGRDKIYNRIAGSEFASSIVGYRIHDISSAEEQNEYELVLLNTLIKSRNVLTDFNIELKEGVALTEEQVKLIEERIKLIQKEMVDTKEMAGAKDKAHRQPFNDALKAFLKNPNDEELGSKLDFQAEKVSKIGAMYKYHAALLQEKNRLEGMLGVKIKENAEVEAKRLEMEAKRDERATGIKAKTAENQSNRALNKNIYKDVGDFLKEEVFGFDVDQLDDAYDEYYEELSEQGKMLGKTLNEEFNFTKYGQVQYDELNRYIDLMTKKIKEWKSQMVSASDEDRKILQDNIEYAEEDMKYLKMLANSITKVNAMANTKSLDFEMEDEANDIEETTEAMKGLVDPKLVARVKTQAENFDFFVQRTHALNEQTHQLKGEVLAMLAYFDRLNKSTDTSNEDWEKLANNLAKYREILGKTEEEINEFAIAEKNKDVKAEEAKALMKATIKQGKEYVKQLQQQMSTMDKETEAWEKRNKAINIFKQLIKDESISKEKIDEQVLGLYNLLTPNKEKDSGDFKESNSNIKIVRQQAKAEEDVAVKYEKQANALYQILKLKKEGKKVSFDINKLIDSEGNGWKKIAEQQKQVYKKMNDHQLWFTASHMNMNETYADEDNIFDPTHFIDFTKELNGREEIINFLSEATAKMHILEELQEKMKTHEPMKNGKASLDIANKTTKARIEEAQAIDAVTAKQKEQQKNEQIHQEWLKKQEIAKAKEPYLKASKEIIKRIKGSTKYKNNKDDEKFMKSVQQTFMYIDNLKHSEATLQQTVDAFENLKAYAHETFNMKNETIKKLVEPFVKIEEAVTQTTEDMKKVESGTKEVAKDAQVSNQATQEKVEADIKATQEIQEQAQAQNKLKENVEATAEATEKQVKAQKEMSAELRKQIILATSDELIEQLPTKLLNNMYSRMSNMMDKGIKLTKAKLKDIIYMEDPGNDLDYSKVLSERGDLVAQGRKKKDGVIYNRTDEYKAKKEAMDKQVEELEKPLLGILKMMENELKGTTAKVTKEVKKSEKQQNKKENKTKAEQNKLAKQQETISSNIDKKQSNILQTAKDILLANKEGRQYILDINSLIDEQGRSWQDIAKNSEKVYKNVKDANILYTSFENMDMNRAYGNDAQSNGIFTPANYIDKDKYDKAKTDAERIALMSEYDGKFGILFSLEEAFKRLLEQENIQENIQEKVETSLYDQIQAIEKMTNAQERFNAILELTGLNYDKILKDNVTFFKDSNEWQRDKNLQTLKMDKNYGLQIGDDKNPYSFLAYKSALPNDPNTVQGINAMGELYAIREVLTIFKEMSEKEEQKAQNEQKTIEIKKEENQVVQQVNQAKKEEVQIINQANEKTSQLKAELDSLEKKLSNLPQTLTMEQLNKRLKEIESDPEYSSIMKNIKNQAREEVKKSGRKVTDNSVFQHMFKLLDNLLMNVNYGGSSSQQILKQYGIKDLEKFKQMNSEHERLTGDKAYVEQVDNERKELEAKIKAKKEELGLSQQINEKEEQTTNTKQKQVTVQKQIVQAKEDSFKVSETEAEIVKKQVTEEEKKAKLQNMIRENKELMLQDDEVQSLKEEITLIDEKTKALKAQGETAKLYENLKMAGVKGKSADLMASNILIGELKGSDYGIEDLKKFKDEQVEIANLALSRADAQMRLDQNKELVEETIAYQRELDKLNGVVEDNTKVQQENTVVSDQLNESTTKGLSDLKSKLETEKQITDTSAKTAQNMSKVAEYEDRRTQVYNDTIQNYLNKAKELKESYVGDEELARMEEERDLLQEKIILMQKQGETFKVLKTIADMADAGKGNFNDMVLQAKMYPDKYGSTNVEKFKQEQEELAVLQKKLGEMALNITEERDKLTTSNQYLEMASDEQRRLREYIKEKTGANEVDAISLKQDKERVEVIKDLIVGLSDANRFIAGDGLNDLGLAKLEAMLQLYQGTDGLSHASFAGTGKDKKYFEHYRNNEEGLITDMATSVIPYELAKYHDLYPKLESWYKELAELAKLGDTPEYKALDKKVQSLFRTIVGTIEGIVYNLLDQPVAKVDLWDAEMIYKSADDYRKEYGMQTVDSSGIEGDKEATALESSVKASMRAITVAQESWGEVKQEVKEVKQEVQEVATATQEAAQDTKEIATGTQEAQNAVEETVKARKEEAKVIKEPIEDLKTLEEYQQKYKKAPKGMTEETFDTESALKIYHTNFSTESIGHLESMMEMFRTKDGGVMPSYKGMALPKEVVESLGADKLNSLLAEYAIRFHKEFQKYVQDSYMRMSHAKDLAEKGESIEDDHYFQKMTKAMEEFKAKLVKDAMKLVEAISKSERSVFMSDDKYDDLSDYWLMEGGKGHDVAMSDTDVWNNVVSQTEYLADQEKELQTVLQIQASKKQIAETTKQEKQDAQNIVNIKQEEAKVTNDVKQEVEEVKQEVETTGAKWKETYVHLSRVVEASQEFKKANLGALEAWDEIKASTESYELDEQWKEAVDAIKEFAEEMEIVIEDEEKLYQQRQQENAKTSLADTKVGEKKAADGKKLDKNGVEKDTKAKNENTKATNKNTEATNKNNKAKEENAKATNKTSDATKKSTKAKKESTQATKEMITIEKDATKDDYRKAALEAITKVGKSNTFKKYSKDDEALKKAFADLETEAKVNKSSSAGIDYWEGLIKRLRDIATKGHVQSSTIDNALIPYIGGTVQKSKASKQVKEMAMGKPSDTNKAVDDAKKIETSTVNTAKAQNDVAKATKVVKVDTNEVAKSTDVVKQNIAETTESLDDLKDIIVSDADIDALFNGTDESDETKLNKLREQAIQAAEANKDYAKQLEEQEEAENKKVDSSEKVVDAKKEEAEVTQEVKGGLQDIIKAKVQESKLQNQIVDEKEEELDVANDIADTQKEVVIITQQANEIDQEKLQAMKDELNAREKLGAEQKAQLQTLKNEIKDGEKKERAINKSIEQENKMIGKMQEKIALAQDAEETAKRENEERIKQRAELEAHIKLLEQQADEKRQAIALLESEVEYTEDNSFQIKQLTKEYDNLQEKISETQAKVDELTDSYYEQQEQARKANNEASQQMIDEYMKRIEEEDEIRRKESAKYLPARSGEVGEYKGGSGGGSVPPSGGGNPPDGIDPDLNERIKLRQRELMLSLQQAVHNKELNDEQKMGVQILAEQILEIGQLTSSMKDLTWLSQNFRENLKEFKFSIKVDEDNKKELARIAEEERKDLVNMWAGLFDEIDANEKLKAEKQSLEELIALYKEKTLAQVDEYSSKNSGYVDQDRVSELRDMIQYMEQNISSAGEYEQVVRNIGNVFRELKFDTNQTKQWYKMEESAEKAKVAQEKQAKAQEELNAKVAKHIQVKKEQAKLYEKEIMSSKAMRNATEQERMEMETLIRTYEIKGNTIQEVNQSYAQMQRLVKDMRLNIISDHMGEQVSLLDKLKNGIKDYVRFSLDLDDVQGVMQNVTRVFQASFEHIKTLDEAYTNINQTMDISIEEFDVMAQKAYEVGDASGALGTDILEMMKIYANANETVESLNAKIVGTTAFQNVSGLSGTDATNALQTIINQFKLTTEEGYSAGDAITYVGDAITGVAYSLSKDEGDAMREIISAVEDAGSVIESAGGSLEWYAAVTGTLAETVNATGSEVGGAMRMITARTLQQKEAFDELNDSGEETEVAMANAEKALTSLGISIRGSDGDLRSIEEVLGDVAEKWSTLSDSDQQFVAEKLAGTNRRSYFMALMENYQRVMELQEKSMTSEGIMMEASEKHAESLAGKLNQLTNAQEKFYQTVSDTSTMKSWIDLGINALDMVTKLAKAMDGKWIPAIAGVVGAYATLRMSVNGIKWSDLVSSVGTFAKKLLGLKVDADATAISIGLLKGVLGGLVGIGLSMLVSHLHEAYQKAEQLHETVSNLKTNLETISGTGDLILEYQKAVENLNVITEGTDTYIAQQERINELRAELVNMNPSFKSILEDENSSLDEQVEKMEAIAWQQQRLAVQEAVDEALPYAGAWGDDVQDSIVDPYKDSISTIENSIKKMEEEKAFLQEATNTLAKAKADEDIIMIEKIEGQIETSKGKIDGYVQDIVDSYATANQAIMDAEDWNELFGLAGDYGIFMNGEEINLADVIVGGDEVLAQALKIGSEYGKINLEVVKTGDNVDEITNSTNEATDATNELAEAVSGVADASGDGGESAILQANKQYIEQLNNIENIKGILDSISTDGYTLEIATEAIDSGLLDDYTGSVEDAIAVQEHLNNKIYEAQEIANQAYYNMMKDDEAFWANKMANSENWRDHEQKVQNDIIALTAQALGIQETDFANFINTKGGFRQVDYSNCNTMAQAENKLQSSLMSQISGYVAQMTNAKAGYRQTDMSNIVQFLNTQGAKEAQTVQELMALWAKFYDAKAKAIQAEIADYNRRTQELVNMETQLGEEAWLEDGALKHGLLNAIKKQSQLKLDNVAMTNYFAGLTAGFSGVGGGVGQSYVGGGGIGGGLGGGTPSTNKVGSGGSGSGRKPSGSGSGSSYKPSGSGSGGSGGSASEQEVEDMELEIDRYYTLNDAITDVENALSKLQAEREKITTKSAYKKSMQQEIDLINQQIKALQNLNKEQTKERNEIKNTLSKNGFKFDSTGDITNYASRLKALQNSANSKSGDKKESAIAQVENLVELIERYNELNDSAIPKTNIEIIELQNSIAELNKELAENMKDIEALGDRYFNVARKIASVDNALAMNSLLQDSTENEERKIELMREEQKLMKQKQQYLKEQKSVAQSEANELMKELKAQGVKFGNGGNIIHYDEMMKDLTIKANSLVGDAQDESVEDAQELLELIEKYVELTEGTIPELDQSWQEYANSIEEVNKEIEEMYHAHQETAVQTQKDIASAYEHYLTERYNKVKEALQEEQDLYNKAYDEENYQRQLKEQQRALDEIAQQIAIYSRDTSQAGKLKLQQLQEEYLEQQEAINDMIRENEKSLVDDRFAEEQEALDKELELLTSPEHLIQVVNDAIGSGLITIGDQVLSLNTVMSNWLNETGDGLYALGGELKTELIDNLQNAKDILGDMGLLKNGSISLASSQALLGSLSNTGALSSSVTFNAPLMTIEGNVDPTVMPELKSELAKLEQTILTKIAKSMK